MTLINTKHSSSQQVKCFKNHFRNFLFPKNMSYYKQGNIMTFTIVVLNKWSPWSGWDFLTEKEKDNAHERLIKLVI